MTTADTSLQAFASIKPHAARMETAILRAIVATGTHGATCDEVEVTLGWSHQGVSARLVDLTRNGHIALTHLRRKTRSGRNAGVYVATIAGIAAAR